MTRQIRSSHGQDVADRRAKALFSAAEHIIAGSRHRPMVIGLKMLQGAEYTYENTEVTTCMVNAVRLR